jgi:hypothetical protein
MNNAGTEGYLCFEHLNVVGTRIAATGYILTDTPTVANCAALCNAEVPTCTFFVWSPPSGGTCTLRYSAFRGGDGATTTMAEMYVACLSQTGRGTS